MVWGDGLYNLKWRLEVRSAEIFKLGLWEEPDLVAVLTTRPKAANARGRFAMFLVLVARVGTKHLVERLTGPAFESQWGRCETQTLRPDLILTAEAIAVP